MFDITVIIPTAREDFNIIGLPDTHILGPCIKSLRKQTFRDFEIVVADALIDRRPNMFNGKPFHGLPFPVKHVPVHPNHRYWLDQRRWNVCGTLNTGIIHSEGELLVRVDDCSEFDEGYLQRFWDGYESGYFPMAMHTRYLGGKQAYHGDEYRATRARYGYPAYEGAEAALLENFENGAPIRDTRWPIVETAGGRAIATEDQFYGYSSFSMEAALKVNGFNEMLDGQKSLDDVDFGMRLVTAGYAKMFLLSTENKVIEHEHSLVSDIIDFSLLPIVCNYAVMRMFRAKGWYRANDRRLNEEDLEYIREESLKPPCSGRAHADDCRGALFDLWASNPPIFDLRTERLEI